MENKITWETNRIDPAFKAWCEKHADRIQAVDYGGGYSHPDTGRECNAYNILLRPGWSISDDTLHTIIEPTMAKAKREVINASACTCSDCQRITSTSTSTHGGHRPGAGRKAIDPDGTVVTTLRLTAKQKATLTMLGGASWIRDQLDALCSKVS